MRLPLAFLAGLATSAAYGQDVIAITCADFAPCAVDACANTDEAFTVRLDPATSASSLAINGARLFDIFQIKLSESADGSNWQSVYGVDVPNGEELILSLVDDSLTGSANISLLPPGWVTRSCTLGRAG